MGICVGVVLGSEQGPGGRDLLETQQRLEGHLLVSAGRLGLGWSVTSQEEQLQVREGAEALPCPNLLQTWPCPLPALPPSHSSLQFPCTAYALYLGQLCD